MSTRAWLRRALTESWQSTVSEAYLTGLINSERGLQVHFCKRLLTAFEEDHAPKPRRLFIEPRIKVLTDSSILMPDILICNSKQIIGIVELKYRPKSKASFAKDMKTLAAFGVKDSGLQVVTERYLGPEIKHPVFTVAQDVVLCWAAVYRAKTAVELASWSLSDTRFLGLHALTQKDEEPTMIPAKTLASSGL